MRRLAEWHAVQHVIEPRPGRQHAGNATGEGMDWPVKGWRAFGAFGERGQPQRRWPARGRGLLVVSASRARAACASAASARVAGQ